nr:hypothetical protein [Tanacetum cinerariifolium]
MGAHDDEARSSRSKRSRQYEMVEEAMLLRLFVAGAKEEIFTSEAWANAFNVKERIYSEICHEFYSTYEFDEVYATDELKTKKIINFRLCGRAFSWTLLEIAKSDEHFNAQEYWLSISREENLSLSMSHASTIWNPVLRVLHKMITYGLCQRTIGYDNIQKNDLWLLSMFDARHQNRYANVSGLIARALDTTTLIELIDSEGRLIHEAPEPGVPRVAIHRPLRALMHDLYERMGSMEIRQGMIKRMYYRQSYHWDMYAEVFEHMARVYSVLLKGAYNPPGYDRQQYDQYYQ